MRLIEASYYRNFDSVLKKKIQGYRSNSRIMKKFREWSSLDKKQAQKALRFDTAPEIQVERIATGKPVGTPGWIAGQFGSKRVMDSVWGHISINRGVIWLLEGIPPEMLKGKNGRSAKLAKAGRQLADFVAQLVMHEIVHWGNWLNQFEEREVDFGAGFQREANLNAPFPKYFLELHSIKDSPLVMRREPPPLKEYDEVAGTSH